MGINLSCWCWGSVTGIDFSSRPLCLLSKLLVQRLFHHPCSPFPFLLRITRNPRGLTRSAASAVIVDSPDGVLPVPCTSPPPCLPTGTASDSTMSGPGRLGADARGPVVRRLRLLFPGAGAGERHEMMRPVSKLRQPKQPKPRRCPPHRQTTTPTSRS